MHNYRNQLSKDKKATLGAGSSLDQLIAKAKEDKNTSKLPLLIKSDVQLFIIKMRGLVFKSYLDYLTEILLA